jgi:glycosyltransferase involved in cell wall biosynthesis
MLAPIMRQLGAQFQLKFTSGLKAIKTRTIVEKNMIPLGRLSNDDDLVKAYQNCDAILLPTCFEGFGYAALEAMACGKPVIASDNSALPEVVQDGVTGILCPTNDIEAFVAACRFLAENPEIGKKYGEAGRARVERLFSEEIIIPQYIALYEKLAMKQK